MLFLVGTASHSAPQREMVSGRVYDLCQIEKIKKKLNKRIRNKGKIGSEKLPDSFFLLLLVFFLSGASLIAVDRYLFPYLATVKWAGKYQFFKKATEDVVVVNKTEQITVSEDQTISHYTNGSASSVVEILSYKSESKNPGNIKDANLVKSGSGLIITADGLVLTYREAIFDDQAKYRIFTEKDKSFDAQLVAMDSFTNLALFKIDGVPICR